jgi:hypothetical protein
MAVKEARNAQVKLSRLISAPVRRSALGLVLVAVVLFPGSGPSHHGTPCRRACSVTGAVSWDRPLTGHWIADGGAQGTVFAHGQAYAAVSRDVAAVGFALTVDAFDAATGFPRWSATLSGVPVGSAIISVRAWPGVVTVGVEIGASLGGVGAKTGAASRQVAAGPTEQGGQLAAGQAQRYEFVLDAVTGKQIRVYQAALFGGAVSASRRQTVIVGLHSVTRYSNATGRVIWRDLTGSAGQAWRVNGNELYVTVSATGEVGTAPVTAVRQINMRTGHEQLIQPAGRSFYGTLSGAIDDVLLFSGADGLHIYSDVTGRLTGARPDAVPEVFDPALQVLYVDVGGALIGIDPVTGKNERGSSYPGPPGTYGVRDGVALGLDPGAHGAAWGYNIAKKHVIWTTKSLPWPHFFVDLSGIGGSVDPHSNRVLLVTCAKVGQAVPSAAAGGGGAQTCMKPRLVAIHR